MVALANNAESSAPVTSQTHTPVSLVQVSGLRYYSPGLGRWLNRDPIGEHGGENLCRFVLNRPTTLIDVLGREPANGSNAKDYTVKDLSSRVKWRAEVQYHWGFLFSSQYRAVAVDLPGSAPSRRFLRQGQTATADWCLWKARKLTVYAEPVGDFPIVDSELQYEPWIAIVKMGQSPVGQFKPTWSESMIYIHGIGARAIPNVTWVDYFFNGAKSVQLDVHRKIYRGYLGAYENVDVDDWDQVLSTLRFELKDEIGPPIAK